MHRFFDRSSFSDCVACARTSQNDKLYKGTEPTKATRSGQPINHQPISPSAPTSLPSVCSVANLHTPRSGQPIAHQPISPSAPAKALLILLLLTLATISFARHPANIASARAKIGVDGRFELRVRFDMLAYCFDLTPAEVQDGPMNALLDGPVADLESRLADARQRFAAHLRVMGDGAPATIDSFSFPNSAEVLKTVANSPMPRLPVMMLVTMTGRLPKGATTSSLKFPDALGEVVLTTEFPYEEPVSEPVDPGSSSTPLTLPTAKQVANVASTIQKRAAAEAAPIPKNPKPQPANMDPFASARAEASLQWLGRPGRVLGGELGLCPRSLDQPSLDGGPKPPSPIENPRSKTTAATTLNASAIRNPQSAIENQKSKIKNQSLPWYAVFPRYVKMGFTHIVPEGLDHILFVLGLFLLSTRFKDLLKQITAFTVAHSLTLALSLYGVVRLPSSVVEPIIALSIVFVAVENLVTTKMHKWRIGVVFLFGLVHGLGFASALKDAGLAHTDFLSALVGFNSGVELGQLSVVAGAFLLVGWFRSHERYRSLVTMPASLLIAATAIIWTIQRLV